MGTLHNKIGKDNFIHPTAIVEDSVKIGRNNHIGPYCYITGNTVIGDNNRFEGYCSIGTPAEHKEYFVSAGKVIIGDSNTVREFCTINAGTSSTTILGNFNIMLKGSHVGHDSVLENKVTLSCNVLIGGHSYIMEGANLGLGSTCHQYSKIGAYSMIGMGSVIVKKNQILPGDVYAGTPAKFIKKNTIGLERGGITEEKLKILLTRFNSL